MEKIAQIEGGAVVWCQTMWVKERLLVTAVLTPSYRFKLVTWRLNSNGTWSRLADSGNTGIRGKRVQATTYNSHIWVTLIDEQQRLWLTQWQINRVGHPHVIWQKNIYATVLKCLLIPTSHQLILAFHTAKNVLHWQQWSIYSQQLLNHQQHTSSISHLWQICHADNNIVMAVQTPEHTLQLIRWSL